MRQTILDLIAQESSSILIAPTFEEKSTRTNNIIQLKIHSGFSDISNDTYVDVKNFISFYIKSLKEKQFNYDEFNECFVVELISRFNIERQCNLLEHTIREVKTENISEKARFFEDNLRQKEFLREWEKLNWKNLLKIIFKGSVYNNWSVIFSLFLCYLFCFVIYLPAPECGIVLFSINYENVSESFILNHFCNVLMSFFEIQKDPFVSPINFGGTIVLILIKVFFISIVVNVLLDHFKSRFKS